jgi:hypothetical protein
MSLYDDASLIMFPSGYKEDKIYSLKPTDGSGDLTFTRASTATRVNSEGLIETSPVNFLQYSEDVSNAAWTQSAVTITANSTTAPNGTTTADTIAFSSGGFCGQTFTNNGLMTISIYAKYIGTQWLCLENFNQSDKAGWFDLLNGVIGGTASGATNSIENVGNGWYRCSVTMTATDVNISTYAIFSVSANNVFTRSGSAYFWGAQLNIGATAKPYFPTTDRLNVPRIDYTGGGCGKLLLESQRTNLLTYSSELDNVAWTKYNSSISANATTSPDGTTNADKIVEDTANASHGAFNSASISNGIAYTWSAFFKAGERTLVRVLAQTGTTPDVTFNLTNGTIVSVAAGVTASIEDYGSGWYRCILTATSSSTTAYFNWNMLNASGDVTYTGDGTSGLYAYGFQLESGSYSTSLIPTLASSVTRLGDAAIKTGASSLIGQTEGVLFADINYISHEAQSIFAIEDWVANGTVIRILADTSTSIGAQVFGGGNQYIATFNSAVNGQRYKCALAYKANDFAFYVNGTQVSTSSSGTVPLTSNVRFGAFISGQVMDGQINQALLFPTRLTNDQLADITGGNITTFNDLATLYGYTIL